MIYVPAWAIALILIIVVGFIVFTVYFSVRTHHKKVAAGKEDLIGKSALVETPLEPRGIVLVEGEHWTATIDKGRAEPEEEVIITSVDGLKLAVTKKQ